MSRRGLVELYNSLPSIEDADAKFVNRDDLFSKVAPLLAKYDGKFGVCLVHRHCLLEEGEMMVATGNVTQPECNVECYPDRWTARGEPYEFTRTVTESLPPTLLEGFQTLTKAHGVDTLGLFYVHEKGSSDGEIANERTEGRKNILEYGRPRSSSVTITNWILGSDGTLTMQASCTCLLLGAHCSAIPTITNRRTIITDCERVGNEMVVTETTTISTITVYPGTTFPNDNDNLQTADILTKTTIIFTPHDDDVITTETISETKHGKDETKDGRDETVITSKTTRSPRGDGPGKHDTGTRETTIVERRLTDNAIVESRTKTFSRITSTRVHRPIAEEN